MSEDVLEEMKWIAKDKFDAAKADLLMNEVHPGQNIDISDPWYGPEPGFHEAYKMIDKACDAIIKRYSNHPSIGGLAELSDKKNQ
jgi:protein-tyrosine phosphatase